MDRLPMASSIASWPASVFGLRIDVRLPASEVETELRALYERIKRPSDPLFDRPTLDIDMPPFRFHYRIADGEHYVYVEDAAYGRLAGYTVFNRLIEVNRQSDRHLRAPHSKFAAAYQRRGLAAAIYRWWLDGNRCLISGARQSVGANALWQSLSTEYVLAYVDLRNKTLRYLGSQIDDELLNGLHTRMILFGRGWSLDKLASATGMQCIEKESA